MRAFLVCGGHFVKYATVVTLGLVAGRHSPDCNSQFFLYLRCTLETSQPTEVNVTHLPDSHDRASASFHGAPPLTVLYPEKLSLAWTKFRGADQRLAGGQRCAKRTGSKRREVPLRAYQTDSVKVNRNSVSCFPRYGGGKKTFPRVWRRNTHSSYFTFLAPLPNATSRWCCWKKLSSDGTQISS